MPPKRPADSLTGGTGDVSPQLLSSTLATSAANTYTELSIPLPVNRFQQMANKAVVVEMLKVYFNNGEADANPAAGGSLLSATAQIATRTQTAYVPGSSFVVAASEKIVRGAFTAAGTYGMTSQDPITIDLTDGAGHGVLVGTDNIFYGVNTAGFTSVSSFSMKILYRFKEVPLQEYIGIVQSQQ